MAFLLRLFAETLEERFNVGEVGGLCGKPVNGPEALGFDAKKNQSAFGAAQISRKDHEQ